MKYVSKIMERQYVMMAPAMKRTLNATTNRSESEKKL